MTILVAPRPEGDGERAGERGTAEPSRPLDALLRRKGVPMGSVASYDRCLESPTGRTPLSYQICLCTAKALSHVLRVESGSGNTAAVMVARCLRLGFCRQMLTRLESHPRTGPGGLLDSLGLDPPTVPTRAGTPSAQRPRGTEAVT